MSPIRRRTKRRQYNIENVLIKKIKSEPNIPPEPIVKFPTAEEAKRFARQDDKLREAQQEVLEQRDREDRKNSIVGNVELKDVPKIPPAHEVCLPSVNEAKKFKDMDKRLRAEFAGVQKKEQLDTRAKEKQYEPITRAIKDRQSAEQKEKRLKQLKTVTLQKRLRKDFVPSAMSTPNRDVTTASDTPPLPPEPEDDENLIDQSIQEYVEERGQDLRTAGSRVHDTS
ncbi:hypothetical protein J6590_051190 [Homalodisca vitripennis]|nr:hypothetical protein J6590_051190 [Homalodisca vitripennis]